MIISYFGKQFFKVQLGDTVVALNPIGKSSKAQTSRFGADVALVTANHPDYNGAEEVKFGDREPFVISGPGEYEVKGVSVKGYPSEASLDGKKLLNTVYVISLEKMNLCFLGSVSTKTLAPETREGIDDVDILFVPLSTLAPADAYALSNALEPKLIIPMDYEEEALKKFLKEGGSEKAERLDKLTVKPKDLEGKEGEIVVLESAA